MSRLINQVLGMEGVNGTVFQHSYMLADTSRLTYGSCRDAGNINRHVSKKNLSRSSVLD